MEIPNEYINWIVNWTSIRIFTIYIMEIPNEYINLKSSF